MSHSNSQLIQDLIKRIELLEKKLDANSLQNYSKEEKQQIDEALIRIGGHAIANNPSLNSVITNSSSSNLVEKVAQKLSNNSIKKKLTEEASKSLPPEAMVSLLRDNRHAEAEDAKHYPLLPDHVHSSVIGLVDDFLDYAHPSKIIGSDPDLTGKIQRAQKALQILQKHGLAKHPAAFMIDELKQKMISTDQTAAFKADRSMGRHNPGYWNVV
jgi:hypothetical protein